MTNSPWQHSRKSGVSDDIDFFVRGEDLQFVEIELDPGESAVAEAGAMVWKDASVGMTTVFGDGSAADQQGGFMGKLLGAGKRLVTGESLFTTVFTHHGEGKARVAFAAPTPGTILPIKLDEVGGTLVERELAPGEELHVDTGCVAAFTSTVDMDVERVGSVKSMFFGGEGVFFARLRGPGKVWIQSLPFSRLAARMFAAMGPTGSNKGEGSALGSFGDIIMGND
jgi:uncharacterized protein (AIM24 family)